MDSNRVVSTWNNPDVTISVDRVHVIRNFRVTSSKILHSPYFTISIFQLSGAQGIIGNFEGKKTLFSGVRYLLHYTYMPTTLHVNAMQEIRPGKAAFDMIQFDENEEIPE